MSYRVKVRERKKNKGAMLSLYLEFMPPYVAPMANVSDMRI